MNGPVAQDFWSPDGVSFRDLAPLVYLPRKPHPALTPWVDHFAVLQVPSLPCGKHDFNFYPDAGITLLFHFEAGEPAGIELRFSDARYQQTYQAYSEQVTVRFRPGGVFTLLGISGDEICSSAHFPLLHPELEWLHEQMAEESSLLKRRDLLENKLLQQVFSCCLKEGPVQLWLKACAESRKHAHNLLTDNGISRRKLERAFRQSAGISPARLYQLLQAKRARMLIRGCSSLSLTEIGQQCGYYDQSHFVRQFRLIIGQTPGEYRQRKLSQLYN